MKITDEKLKEMIELSGKATPGPWRTSIWTGPIEHRDGFKACIVGHGPIHLFKDENIDAIRDAEFISSANPDTVKSICQELLEAREALKFYSDWHNWTWEDQNKFHDLSELTNIVDDSNSLEYIEADGETYKNTFGGKRAREFLKKWKDE